MSADNQPTSQRRGWSSFIPKAAGSSSRPSTPKTSPPTENRASGLLESPISSTPDPDSFVIVPSSSTIQHAAGDAAPPSRPSTPKRWSSKSILTYSPKVSPQTLDNQATQLIAHALERTNSQQQNPSSAKSPDSTKNGGSFGKSFSSMMGGLSSSLSLSRTSTRESTIVEDKDKDRGRSMLKVKRIKSASQAPGDDGKQSRSVSRARSQSPFTFRRFRNREPSPTPEPVRMSQSDADLSDTSSSVLPRTTAYTDDESGDEFTTDAETDYASSSDQEDTFDPITELNTERNAIIPPVVDPSTAAHEIEDPDPVGEGVNVVVAPEPYFPSSLNALGTNSRGKRNPRRRKSVKTHEPLPYNTSRPVFQRDRCTITLTQGDPEGKLGDRRKRRYVVASDLSEESRYAVEWGIGTVLRDGDEMTIVTVVENESKVDPAIPNAADRAVKLRSQQERQGLAYILVRQVTGLLQRTKLNVTISCQAWHAKNSRHMLLDIVDHIEPIMLIVGSRGLGQLNGILLGSTSHYLIQKCSVPVMVARRRLKRPPRKSAHLSTQRTHISLAEAGIDRVAAKVDQDVQIMRDEIQKDDNRRDGGPGSRNDRRFGPVNEGEPVEEDENEDENDNENDLDDESAGVKVAG
ncbi:hypothetical protein JR316_0007067 [Psilocybe cubensis]|uniref:Uncharacterized protein n=2 Tax=Psilocybe cubensis TaxID=181762 RepID=A0ACB8GYG1_PSICU|nr:hypothetical protein JR316_0007067 [Psilocybe cubensis]KAH9480467.1 hypothetical protein JR316_0007067 [Psilocybe cubensis]